MTSSAIPARLGIRIATFEFGRWTGLVAGFILPLIAAVLFRTYHVALASSGLESMRQLGLVYLAGEITVVLYARRHGLDLARIVRGLPHWARTALLFFLATFWISSAVASQMVPFSLGLCLGWIVHLLFAASLYHLASSVREIDTNAIAGGFVAGLFGMTALTVVHFAAVSTALLGQASDFGRGGGIDLGSAIPGFISSRLFGSWCGAVLALLTGIAWQRDAAARNAGRTARTSSTEHPTALYAMLALAFGLTVWTATRAALMGWGISMVTAWFLAGRPASRTVWTRLPFYLVAAGAIALLLPPYGNGPFTFFRWAGATSTDAATSGRLTLWARALHVAAEYPLLGSGAGSSWWLVSLDGFYHVQPHNAVVQFLLNWGLIPTIPALALLLGATWHAHCIARRHRGLLPVILMLDCLLSMSLFDGMLHFAQFVMLIFGCLAICLARDDRPRAPHI
ncbi:O-antigen ligase-like membrane protein [Sphingomonas sp. BK036]|uniref:O-antigen ligase family protein n=1 Tax=Sphingomonas sp. BK036 TaxID=2512122 RepID=UPI00102A671E|nr:O-antigen ligase family protein [Sphingomonas sp. BK036]RZT44877.1 O-antigen ligase-like membrane protein [Sphingomonas sp. BK036]